MTTKLGRQDDLPLRRHAGLHAEEDTVNLAGGQPLLVAERGQRLHTVGPAGGKEAGEKGSGRQDEREAGESGRIVDAHSVEEARQVASQRQGGPNTPSPTPATTRSRPSPITMHLTSAPRAMTPR